MSGVPCGCALEPPTHGIDTTQAFWSCPPGISAAPDGQLDLRAGGGDTAVGVSGIRLPSIVAAPATHPGAGARELDALLGPIRPVGPLVAPRSRDRAPRVGRPARVGWGRGTTAAAGRPQRRETFSMGLVVGPSPPVPIGARGSTHRWGRCPSRRPVAWLVGSRRTVLCRTCRSRRPCVGSQHDPGQDRAHRVPAGCRRA